MCSAAVSVTRDVAVVERDVAVVERDVAVVERDVTVVLDVAGTTSWSKTASEDAGEAA